MNHALVRGCWLTSGLKFVGTTYPPETNERLLGGLPKALRAMLTDLEPVGWYARTHHVDLLKSIVSAHRDETAAYESLLAYGQSVATDLANGSARPLMAILTT